MESFVKLKRRFMEWRWYHDSAMTHLFTHLIMRANYSDTDWQDITVKRGQLVTSRHALAMETGLSEKVSGVACVSLKRLGCKYNKQIMRYGTLT